MRRRQFIGAATATMASLRAIGRPAAADERTGPVLRRVVASELTSLDPQRPTGVVTTEMAAELFTGLTAFDSAGRIAAGCARDWSATPDGLRWQFRLRPGLAWSDGAPLTARDFVVALRRYVTPATGAGQASRLDAIRGARDVRFGRQPPERLGVSAPDAATVAIELERPELELPARLALAYCVPAHVLASAGNDWARPDRIVSNGPYALDSWAPGAKVVKLRRNPRFHNAAGVSIERVEWLTGYDDPTRLRLFRLGEAQIVSIEDAGSLATARRDFGPQLRSSQELAVGWIGVNLARKPLDDARIRRALSLATDRPVIATRVRALGDAPSDALLPPGLPDLPRPAAPDYAPWPMPRRLEAASALMQQAGYGGARRLRVGIGFPIPNSTARRVFLAIAAMWRPIGVDVELQPLEGRAYNAALQKGQFDLFSYNSFALVPGASVFLDRFLSDSSINFCAYRSAAFDRAFGLAERQLRVVDRQRYNAEAEAIVLRDLPVIPLYVQASNRLVAARVRGWVDHPGLAHPSRFLSLA